jgi:hypothetical protein
MSTLAPRPNLDDLDGDTSLVSLALAPVRQRVDLYGEASEALEQIESLERPQIGLMAADRAHSEICNGGFYQLFYNSSGLLVPEAMEGFEMLDVPELAEIVRSAVETFEAPYPRDRESRLLELTVVENATSLSEHELFHNQDSSFLETTDSTSFRRREESFVREHPERFFE